jgi:hypothetical protein
MPASPVSASFVCPLTKKVFVDPVVCSDGYTYERSAIEIWMLANATSPITNERLESGKMTPNIVLRNAIAEWRLVNDTKSDDADNSSTVHMKYSYCELSSYRKLNFSCTAQCFVGCAVAYTEQLFISFGALASVQYII